MKWKTWIELIGLGLVVGSFATMMYGVITRNWEVASIGGAVLAGIWILSAVFAPDEQGKKGLRYVDRWDYGRDDEFKH